jgi:GTP-binding protein
MIISNHQSTDTRYATRKRVQKAGIYLNLTPGRCRLVGFPNAGKSTLLSVVSAAKPKIADYPFTTLTPNLGIVSYHSGKSFLMADIPGIIEGAHEGKGLGLRFLRHIERNSVLLFMVPCDSSDIIQEYGILINELEKYNPELLDKKRVLAITKSDLLDDELIKEIRRDLPDIPWVFISSFTKKGIREMKNLLWRELRLMIEFRHD